MTVNTSCYEKYIFNNKVNEQDFLSLEKIKSFSESYIVSCALKTLLLSTVLSYVGFSFSTAFVISFAVITSTSFISFAISSIKTAIETLVKKSMDCLTQVAEVINNIFKKTCAFIKSLSLAIFDFLKLLRERAFLVIPDKKLQINYAITSPAFLNPTKETTLPLADFQPIPVSAVALEESTDLTSYTVEEAPQIKEDSQTIIFSELKEAPQAEETTLPLADFQPIPVSAVALEESTDLTSYTVEEAPQIKEDSQTIIFSELKEAPQAEETILPLADFQPIPVSSATALEENTTDPISYTVEEAPKTTIFSGFKEDSQIKNLMILSKFEEMLKKQALPLYQSSLRVQVPLQNIQLKNIPITTTNYSKSQPSRLPTPKFPAPNLKIGVKGIKMLNLARAIIK